MGIDSDNSLALFPSVSAIFGGREGGKAICDRQRRQHSAICMRDSYELTCQWLLEGGLDELTCINNNNFSSASRDDFLQESDRC